MSEFSGTFVEDLIASCEETRKAGAEHAQRMSGMVAGGMLEQALVVTLTRECGVPLDEARAKARRTVRGPATVAADSFVQASKAAALLATRLREYEDLVHERRAAVARRGETGDGLRVNR